MINNIFKNISSLIDFIGKNNKSYTNNIDAFIDVLAAKKGKNECLSDVYVRKLKKCEVKDMELITLFSIAYSCNISMEKFILSEQDFNDVLKNTMILPKQEFDLCKKKLRKELISLLQIKLKDIIINNDNDKFNKVKINNSNYKYYLSKKFESKYMLEILSKKNNKLIRVNTLIKILECIEYKEIDRFMKELYNSWSTEIDIYCNKGGCK